MALIGPKIRPRLGPRDFHLIVNDETEKAKLYNYNGILMWTEPVLAKGWNGPTTWRIGGDTPPGLYKLGELYITQPWEDIHKVGRPYGLICYDMIELENQENERGRSGICAHGEGVITGGKITYPPRQQLSVTSGCLRFHNYVLRHRILPLTHYGPDLNNLKRKDVTVYVSVYQDYD